jgi:WD40 repeat protein
VAFSPDGRLALSGSHDTTLKLWEVASGRELKSFSGHTGEVNSVAFSPDGHLALSGSDDHTLKLWEVASGRELRSFIGHTNGINSVAFSRDGALALSGSWDETLKLWEVATGRELRRFAGHTGDVHSVAFSSDGRLALSGSWDKTLKLWDIATGRELRSFSGHTGPVYSVAFSADGALVLSADGAELKLWDAASGRELRSFTEGGAAGPMALSPDGRLVLSGNTLKLWELVSGRELRSFATPHNAVSLAFSADGKLALSGGHDKLMKLWELATGRELRSFSGHTGAVDSVAFSPDGKLALSGSYDNTLKLWELASGREIRSFTGHAGWVTAVAFSRDGRLALSGSQDNTLKLWEVASGRELRSFAGHAAGITSVAFSPNDLLALSGSDGTLKLWEVASGRELRSLAGHQGWVTSLAFFRDGQLAMSGGSDGAVRLWDLQKSVELAAVIASSDDNQLTVTPQGFFAALQRDTDTIAIVRGIEVTTIGQVHQSLYNPDLVREALAGDPDSEVKRAAEVINLDKVLDSGPAPEAEIVSQPLDRKSDADIVTVGARIKDRGTGIGRVEFRVNDITAAVHSIPAGPGPVYEIKQELALDAGENLIEVIAYNKRNLLASLPAKTRITYSNRSESVKPKLHILAIGINAYHDKGWTRPGTSEIEYFPPLSLAAGDATGFAAQMKKAALGLYSDVRIRTALNEDAQSQRLDRIVQDMSAEIGPRDTFVLYAAAHGYSHEGRFYLIPQDYTGGPDPEALASRAIDQERLQDWVSNRIKAKRALILLDTCESGALTNGYAHSRVDAPASEAAVGRLHEATGRPVLTAAAAGRPAFEGYHGHGVFTWAVIDALYHGDSNGDGAIQLSELAAHVQNAVPKISDELNGKGRAAIAVRGFGDDRQTAHFGATGGDFALVNRLQ